MPKMMTAILLLLIPMIPAVTMSSALARTPRPSFVRSRKYHSRASTTNENMAAKRSIRPMDTPPQRIDPSATWGNLRKAPPNARFAMFTTAMLAPMAEIIMNRRGAWRARSGR